MTSLIEKLITPSRVPALRKELHHAEIELDKAHSGREYAEAMIAYHTARIARLKSTLDTLTPPPVQS